MKLRASTRGRLRPGVVVVIATAAVGLTLGIVGFTRALAATSGAIIGYGGKCVDVAGAGIANGTRVQLWDCNGTGAQRWTATAGQLINPNANKCLDATGPSSADGTPLQSWTCTGGDSDPSAVRRTRVRYAVADTHTHRSAGRRPRPRAQRVRVRPVDVQRHYPEPAELGVQPAAKQPVRHEPVRAVVQARLVQRRCQCWLLHAGARSGPAARRRHHQRRRPRRGGLVPGQRNPELLAIGREPVGQPALGYRPVGGLPGGAVPPDACARLTTAR